MTLLATLQSEVGKLIADLLCAHGAEGDAARLDWRLDPPLDEKHGELTTRAAFLIGSYLDINPNQIAEELQQKLEALVPVHAVQIAQGGLLNLTLNPQAWIEEAQTFLTQHPTTVPPEQSPQDSAPFYQAAGISFPPQMSLSLDDPYCLVQYAHARCCSVLRMAQTAGIECPEKLSEWAQIKPDLLTELEAALIRRVAFWPRVQERSDPKQHLHRIAFFLIDFAQRFHRLWQHDGQGAIMRFIKPSAPHETMTGLWLVKTAQTLIADGLNVIGCAAMKELKDAQTRSV